MTTIRQTRTLPALLACLALFGCTNFVMGPLMLYITPNGPAAALVYACFGGTVAQASLHAIWCVLAPVGFAKRFTVGVGTGLFLFVAWALGQGIYHCYESFLRDYYWETVLTVLLGLPLVLIAIQLPLWLMRMWCGWRILHQADSSQKSEYGAFGIRDLLVATAMLAVALSSARLALRACDLPDDATMLPLVTGAGAAAAVSLFVTLPAVIATLRARRLGRALLLSLLLYVAVAFGAVAILSLVAGRPPTRQTYFGIAFISASLYGCLVGVMLIMRRLGYRLHWGRVQSEEHQASSSDVQPFG